MIIDNAVRVGTRPEWRDWLSEHHQLQPYCWLITAKNDPISYLDIVEEALCFGWIDSTRKRIDENQTAQRFSPRRRNSSWTELNKERVRRLERLGLMTEAGRSVLPDMGPDSFVIQEEILQRLKQDEELYGYFQAMPELYVRIRIDNIQSVEKDAALYASRLDKFITHTRENKMYGQWHDEGRLVEEGF